MNPAILIASILGIFIGLAVTLFGERIFKISLTSTGFGVGAMLAGGIAFNMTENIIVALIVGVIAGFISSLLVRSAYRTGLFLIGFAMAAIVVTYISLAMDAVSINIQNLENINPNTIQQMLPLIASGFVASIITGSLIVMFDTPILRVATAIFGALIFAISGFVLTSGMDSLPQSTASLVSVDLFVWGIGWIPLAIVGVIFQFVGANWLLRFLQIDQASRSEKARHRAYQENRQQQQMTNQYQAPPTGYPSQNDPQQGGYPDQPRSPQGNPPQQRNNPNQARPSQGNPQRRQRPPSQQPPRRKQ